MLALALALALTIQPSTRARQLEAAWPSRALAVVAGSNPAIPHLTSLSLTKIYHY